MGLLDQLLRRLRPAPDETGAGPADPTADTAPHPATRPRPGSTDTLPPLADTLVVYALDAAAQRPDGDTPCMVVLDFDPVDVQRVFAASAHLEHSAVGAFRGRLAQTDDLRDPNSRGRLEFVRRWLAEHDPPHVGWRLEPAATAGSGLGDPAP